MTTQLVDLPFIAQAITDLAPALPGGRAPIYLAQPYMAPDPQTRRDRVEAGQLVAAGFLHHNLPVYAPVVFSAGLGRYLDEIDESLWLSHGMAMLAACGSLVVLRLPGWDRSRGVAIETRLAEMLGKPTFALATGRE